MIRIKQSTKKESGQIIALMLLLNMSLVMLWMTVINVGKIITDRTRMQNAADAASYTAATLKAQALENVGLYNVLMAFYLHNTLGFKWFWIPYLSAKEAYAIYTGHSTLLNLIIKTSPLYIYKQALSVAEAHGATSIFPGLPGKRFSLRDISTAFSLRLKRKSQSVHFFDTIIIDGVPVPAYGFDRRVKTLCYFKDNKGPRRITITTLRKYKSGFFPLGKKFLGMDTMPDIYTVSTARTYNPKGSMFSVRNPGKPWKAIVKWFKAKQKWRAQLIPVRGRYRH